MDFQKAYLDFKNWSASITVSLRELFPSVGKTTVFHIDLSENNSIVTTEKEFNNPDYLSAKLDDIQANHPTKIIAGGYLEKRALYTSDIYKSVKSNEKRNTHLGVDFWLPEQTPVHAVFDGEVVCSIHQKPFKGYGGFVILKHQINNLTFFTLYGHLSKKSVLQFKTGDSIKKGERIGFLGSYKENGEWVSHLHFQIMLDLLNYTNDFPGVVLEKGVDYWKKICPNPNLLFKLKGLQS